MNCFSHKHYQPHPSPQQGGQEGFAKSHQKKEHPWLPRGSRVGRDGRGCTLTHSPDSGCEEAIPVATESSMSLSEVTRTHKKTRAFREDRAGTACLPPGGGLGHLPQAALSGASLARPSHMPLPHAAGWPRVAKTPSRGWLKQRFSEHVKGGWSLELFGMSQCGRAAPAPRPSPPARRVRSHALLRTTPHCGLCTLSNNVQKEPSGAWPGGPGRAGGRGLPHRSGQLPQEAPSSAGAPLGAALSPGARHPPVRRERQPALGDQMQK